MAVVRQAFVISSAAIQLSPFLLAVPERGIFFNSLRELREAKMCSVGQLHTGGDPSVSVVQWPDRSTLSGPTLCPLLNLRRVAIDSKKRWLLY